MNEHVSNEKPLITFALFAYNQEKYIREAVEGALAQTYSPLQIILSDDCSSDRTFEIMSEMVVEYSGPHEVLLNRNEKNRGIGGHINTVMKISKGELCVVAAGDDISIPERVGVIVDSWLVTNKKAMSLHSAYTEIDMDGNSIRLTQNRNAKEFTSISKCISENIGVTGATHAWAKVNFDVFGPLRDDLTHEDCAIPLRSMLLGRVEYIDIPLVKYRVNIGISNVLFNDINDELHGKGAVAAERYYIDYLQKMQDLTTFGVDKILIRLCSRQLKKLTLIKSLAKTEAPKLQLLFQAISGGVSIWFAATRTLKYALPSLITLQRYLISKARRVTQLFKPKLTCK